MCECGCGNFNPYKAYKMGENVLAVEIYPGCEECGTGLMVSLHIFTPDEAKHYDMEPTEEFKPDEFGWAEMSFPIIGKDDLLQAAKDNIHENGEPIEEQGYENIPDWISDNGLDLLQRGLRLRLKDVEENQKKAVNK